MFQPYCSKSLYEFFCTELLRYNLGTAEVAAVSRAYAQARELEVCVRRADRFRSRLSCSSYYIAIEP
eukprot:COSAG02_NODE_21804_length_774_cov_1.457778_2_plen_67_part_00